MMPRTRKIAERNETSASALGGKPLSRRLHSLGIYPSVVGATICMLFASITTLHAACTVSDLGDAFEAGYDTIKDVTTSASCAPIASNPGFWAFVALFSAGTVSTPQLRDACTTIQEVANTTGDSREKAQNALNKLPASLKKTLEQKLGGAARAANEAVNGVLLPLAWTACACHVANSAGIKKTFSVAGTCFKDALCGIDEVITGRGCDSGQKGITTVDCTKGVIGFGWKAAAGGLYVNNQGASLQGNTVGFACLCPPPMKLGQIFYTNPNDHPGCYANGKVTTEGCKACVCPFPSKRVAMGVCICPDGSPVLPNGKCPSPCKGNCPKGQVLKAAVRLANGQCSSACACPPGQTLVGDKCGLGSGYDQSKAHERAKLPSQMEGTESLPGLGDTFPSSRSKRSKSDLSQPSSGAEPPPGIEQKKGMEPPPVLQAPSAKPGPTLGKRKLQGSAAQRLFCQTYADTAVVAANDNQAYNCGGTGPRWTTDRTAHLNWCVALNGDKGPPNAETEARNKLLVTCRRPDQQRGAPARESGQCGDNMFLGPDGTCYPVLR